jgi:hypothetical protein
MVFFVLKGGEYALKYLRYKTIQSKCRLSRKKSPAEKELRGFEAGVGVLLEIPKTLSVWV